MTPPLTKDDLERLTDHIPIGLVVELVEFRFRDRLKKIFWAGMSTLLMPTLAMGGISFQILQSRQAGELSEREERDSGGRT